MFDFKKYKNHLLSKKILAYPTETVWGLGVLPFDQNNLKKIDQIKNRKLNQSYSVLVSHIEMAKKIVYINSSVEKLLQVFWPGPVTFVLKARDKKLAHNLRGNNFIGLRCSNHYFIKEFMLYLNQPLVTTSANRSGQRAATNLKDLSWLTADESLDVLAVNDLKNNLNTTNIESTVVKIEEQNSDNSTKKILQNKAYKVSVLRSGSLSKKLLKQELKNCGINFY